MTLLNATKPSTIEVEPAPGQTIEAALPREAVPRFGIVQLMRQSDGTYVPILKSWSNTVRLKLDTMNNLGLDVSYKTTRRLIIAGFVKGSLIAPETFLLDVESLYEHLQATRDPEFWTEARKAQYRAAQDV